MQDAIVKTVVSLTSLFLIEQSVQDFFSNFGTVTDNESVRHFQKYTAGIYFNLYPKKKGSTRFTSTSCHKSSPYINCRMFTTSLTAPSSNGSHHPSDNSHRHRLKPFLNHGREDQGRGSIGHQRGRWNFIFGKKCKDIVMDL